MPPKGTRARRRNDRKPRPRQAENETNTGYMPDSVATEIGPVYPVPGSSAWTPEKIVFQVRAPLNSDWETTAQVVSNEARQFRLALEDTFVYAPGMPERAIAHTRAMRANMFRSTHRFRFPGIIGSDFRGDVTVPELGGADDPLDSDLIAVQLAAYAREVKRRSDALRAEIDPSDREAKDASEWFFNQNGYLSVAAAHLVMTSASVYGSNWVKEQQGICLRSIAADDNGEGWEARKLVDVLTFRGVENLHYAKQIAILEFCDTCLETDCTEWGKDWVEWGSLESAAEAFNLAKYKASVELEDCKKRLHWAGNRIASMLAQTGVQSDLDKLMSLSRDELRQLSYDIEAEGPAALELRPKEKKIARTVMADNSEVEYRPLSKTELRQQRLADRDFAITYMKYMQDGMSGKMGSSRNHLDRRALLAAKTTSADKAGPRSGPPEALALGHTEPTRSRVSAQVSDASIDLHRHARRQAARREAQALQRADYAWRSSLRTSDRTQMLRFFGMRGRDALDPTGLVNSTFWHEDLMPKVNEMLNARETTADSGIETGSSGEQTTAAARWAEESVTTPGQDLEPTPNAESRADTAMDPGTESHSPGEDATAITRSVDELVMQPETRTEDTQEFTTSGPEAAYPGKAASLATGEDSSLFDDLDPLKPILGVSQDDHSIRKLYRLRDPNSAEMTRNVADAGSGQRRWSVAGSERKHGENDDVNELCWW